MVQQCNFTPLVLEHTLLRSEFLWGECSICAPFCSYNQSLQFSSPRSTRHPSLLGRQKQHRLRSLPNTSTYDQHWELNPRHFWYWVQRPISFALSCHMWARPQDGATICHCAKKLVTTMLTYPWKSTVLHCNHLGNTWKPLVLMT